MFWTSLSSLPGKSEPTWWPPSDCGASDVGQGCVSRFTAGNRQPDHVYILIPESGNVTFLQIGEM